MGMLTFKALISAYMIRTINNGQWEQGYPKIVVLISQVEFIDFQSDATNSNVRGKKWFTI